MNFYGSPDKVRAGLPKHQRYPIEKERNVPYPTQLAFEAFESQSPMGKGAMWPNLNVFGFLSCRYAYAHDKNLKNIRKELVC